MPAYRAANPIVEAGGQVGWNGGSFTAAAGIGGVHQDSGYVNLTGVQPGSCTTAASPARPAGTR